MGRKKPEDFTCEILEVIDVLEQGNKDWAKVLMKVSWNDNAPTLDVRNIDMSTIDQTTPKMGKGVSLSDEGMERLALALLKEGYVSTDDLNEIIESREGIFKKSKKHKIKIKRKK